MDIEQVRFLGTDDGVREGRMISGSLGEYMHRIFAATIPVDWTLEQAQKAIDQIIQPERCHHEYDCCGRFYGGWATVLAEDHWDGEPETKVIWIRRIYAQNI